MSQALDETLHMLRAAGFEPRVDARGRHLKVRFTDQQNRARLIVISRSPGTSFALQRNRALVRRMLRAQS
jgi:hypothetical protein